MSKGASTQPQRELGDRPILADVQKSRFYAIAVQNWSYGVNPSAPEKSKKSSKKQNHSSVISDIFKDLTSTVKTSPNPIAASSSLFNSILTLNYLQYLEK